MVQRPLRFLACCLFALLTGCASNCSLLSTNHSLGCQAEFAGLLITAPVWVPVADAYDKYKKVAHENRIAEAGAFAQRVRDGNLDAIVECLANCPWINDLQEDPYNLRLVAAHKFVEYEKQPPEEKMVMPTLIAHLILGRTEWGQPMDWQAAETHIPEAHKLIHHPNLPRWLKDGPWRLNVVDGDPRREVIYYQALVSLHHLPGDEVEKWFQTCPQSITKQLPDNYIAEGQDLCPRIYERFLQRVPSSELKLHWKTLKSKH